MLGRCSPLLILVLGCDATDGTSADGGAGATDGGPQTTSEAAHDAALDDSTTNDTSNQGGRGDAGQVETDALAPTDNAEASDDTTVLADAQAPTDSASPANSSTKLDAGTPLVSDAATGCVDGDLRRTQAACDGGVLLQRCQGGVWQGTAECHVQLEACEVRGATRHTGTACGRNGAGSTIEVCDGAQWQSDDSCDDPDVCRNGEERVASCLDAAEVEQVCMDGQWAQAGACKEPALPACEDTETRYVACGLNGRGTQFQRCQAGWQSTGECDDPDECAAGTTDEQACGVQDLGIQQLSCEAGRWTNTGECHEPNACNPGSALTSIDAGASCEACDTGNYCPGGLKGAEACLRGLWDADHDPSTPCVGGRSCQPGSVLLSGASLTSDTLCRTCAVGNYCAGGGSREEACNGTDYDDDRNPATPCVFDDRCENRSCGVNEGRSCGVCDTSETCSEGDRCCTQPSITWSEAGPGWCSGVKLAGDIAYLNADPGLYLVDIHDPTAPTPLGWLTLADYFDADRDIAVFEDHAYISNGHGGLRIVHIGDGSSIRDVTADVEQAWPLNPQGGEPPIARSIGGVEVVNGILFVGSGQYDSSNPFPVKPLYAFALSEAPAQPVLLAWNDINGILAYDMAASGNRLYVLGLEGLMIIDVSDPANPILSGPHFGTGSNEVIASGDYVYLNRPVNSVNTWTCVNADGSGSPQVLGTGVLTAADGLVYLHSSDGLSVFEAGSTTALWSQGSALTATSLSVRDSMLYVTAGDGLHAFSVDPVLGAIEVGAILGGPRVEALTMQGQSAYAVSRVVNRGPRRFDLTVPETPIPMAVENASTFRGGGAVTIVDERLYRFTRDNNDDAPSLAFGLKPFLLDSETEELAGFVCDYGSNIDVANGKVFAAAQSAGLRVFDLSELNGAPAWSVGSFGPLCGRTPPPEQDTSLLDTQDVKVTSDYAYVADGYNGFAVVDLESHTVIGSLPLEGTAYAVALSGSLAYVAAGNGGLHVIDVSAPDEPVLLATASTTNAQDVAIDGERAYVADGSSGLLIFDVSTPPSAQTPPVRIGSVDTHGSAVEVTVNNGLAYVADSHEGLVVVDVAITCR